MPWRRKPDGRPYADLVIHGRRVRKTLLKRAERHQGPPYPDDDECERRYRLMLQAGAATLAAHTDGIQPGDPTIAELFGWYVDVVMLTRGNRPTSRDKNRVIFKRWCDALRAQGIRRVHDLARRPGAIEDHAAEMLRTYKPGSVMRDIRSLKAVFRAAVMRRVIKEDPVLEWPRYREPDPREPRPITPEEMQAFCEHLRAGTRYGRSSLYNVLRFIAFTGCRPCDAAGLRRSELDHLDTDEPIAMLRQQKTGRYVAIALSPPAVDAIRDELARGRSSTYVFLDRRGKPWTAHAIGQGVRHHAHALGMPHITAKTFRQTVVSVLYDSGADGEMVRRITGHRSDAIEAYRRIRQSAAHDLARQFAQAVTLPLEQSQNPRGGDTKGDKSQKS